MPDTALANDQMLPKSLSDSDVIDSPPTKSPSATSGGIFVDEMSSSQVAAGDRFWIILAHTPAQPMEIILTAGEEELPAEDVVERDKLVTFVVPRLPTPSQDVQLCLRSASAEVRIPVSYSESDRKLRRSPSQLHDSLIDFAKTGDTLPLLRPFVASIGTPDPDLNTCLHLAAKNSQSYALKALLSALPEEGKQEIVDARNIRGQTALHCAIRSGDPDSVHYLVNHQANVAVEDGHKNTAIHYLADAYNDAIFKEVLEPKNEVLLPLELLNDEGMGALHLAVRRLKLSLVEMLLEVGCQLNAVDGEGKTPLMHAVIMNDVELVMFLLQQGAETNTEDKAGATALLLARQNANYVIIGMLLDGGADPKQKNQRGESLEDWDDETVKRVIQGHRVTPPPKEVDFVAPKDLPSTRESLFGRSVRRTVDNGICSRVILKRAEQEDDEVDEVEVEEQQQRSPSPGPFGDDQPSTSRASATVGNGTQQNRRAFCKDDISCLDYLTRLRLSKVLDIESKWQELARELDCEHMVELISICSDEDSSPSMILLDQFEQLPDAKISRVRAALERLGHSEAVALIDQRVVF